jgi:hypothetical protein
VRCASHGNHLSSHCQEIRTQKSIAKRLQDHIFCHCWIIVFHGLPGTLLTIFQYYCCLVPRHSSCVELNGCICVVPNSNRWRICICSVTRGKLNDIGKLYESPVAMARRLIGGGLYLVKWCRSSPAQLVLVPGPAGLISWLIKYIILHNTTTVKIVKELNLAKLPWKRNCVLRYSIVEYWSPIYVEWKPLYRLSWVR